MPTGGGVVEIRRTAFNARKTEVYHDCVGRSILLYRYRTRGNRNGFACGRVNARPAVFGIFRNVGFRRGNLFAVQHEREARVYRYLIADGGFCGGEENERRHHVACGGERIVNARYGNFLSVCRNVFNGGKVRVFRCESSGAEVAVDNERRVSRAGYRNETEYVRRNRVAGRFNAASDLPGGNFGNRSASVEAERRFPFRIILRGKRSVVHLNAEFAVFHDDAETEFRNALEFGFFDKSVAVILRAFIEMNLLAIRAISNAVAAYREHNVSESGMICGQIFQSEFEREISLVNLVEYNGRIVSRGILIGVLGKRNREFIVRDGNRVAVVIGNVFYGIVEIFSRPFNEGLAVVGIYGNFFHCSLSF